MYDRILASPRQSFFLFGPRGTGKSTWIKQIFKQEKTINLLDERLYQNYLRYPELLGDELRAMSDESWVIIDEIQRVPQLLNTVHMFMEDKGMNFVLSGSSARKLKQAGVNLLAGRAIIKNMYPFVPEELQSDFNLENTLRYGSIPIVQTSKDKRATLESYVLTYLKEEIKAEALVRNLPGFSRFLTIAVLFHGQTLNIQSLARDSQVARTTVSDYIEILEDTLLATRLKPYVAHLRVREKRHPKLYWIDPGLVRAVKNSWYEVTPDERGSLFEGYIFMLLKAYNQKFHFFDEIYYWAPTETQNVEVDFLLKTEKGIIALEIKSYQRFRSEDTKGLKAIAELKGVTRRILVYQGDKKYLTAEGIEVMPFIDFLHCLEHNLW